MKRIFLIMTCLVTLLLSACGRKDDYDEIYRQAVMEDEGDGTLFSLIYLDDDDIPELVVYNGCYEHYSVYTVRDGQLFCMVDSMTTVEMVYFERSGIIASFARWNGGGDEGGYGWCYYQTNKSSTLTEDAVPVLDYSYNAVYDEEGIYTGGGITAYYYMGQETDQASYEEKMNALGITEGGGKICLENAFGKEEL